MEHGISAEAIWGSILAIVIGMVIFVLQGHITQNKKTADDLTETKLDLAKNYVRTVDLQVDISRIMAYLDVMGAKIDRLIERKTGDTL